MTETSLPGRFGAYTAMDRHFTLPGIRRVTATRPFRWLRLGWRDWRRNPLSSAIYGLAFALGGVVLAMSRCSNRFGTPAASIERSHRGRSSRSAGCAPRARP